jgi:hypothetical protein
LFGFESKKGRKQKENNWEIQSKRKGKQHKPLPCSSFRPTRPSPTRALSLAEAYASAARPPGTSGPPVILPLPPPWAGFDTRPISFPSALAHAPWAPHPIVTAKRGPPVIPPLQPPGHPTGLHACPCRREIWLHPPPPTHTVLRGASPLFLPLCALSCLTQHPLTLSLPIAPMHHH